MTTPTLHTRPTVKQAPKRHSLHGGAQMACRTCSACVPSTQHSLTVHALGHQFASHLGLRCCKESAWPTSRQLGCNPLCGGLGSLSLAELIDICGIHPEVVVAHRLL